MKYSKTHKLSKKNGTSGPSEFLHAQICWNVSWHHPSIPSFVPRNNRLAGLEEAGREATQITVGGGSPVGAQNSAKNSIRKDNNGIDLRDSNWAAEPSAGSQLQLEVGERG